MNPLSVIIITRNEETNIGECIRSARQVSDDIVVVDSGSTDATIALAAANGARVFTREWKGYGHARNQAASLAVNDWILALDADERISEDLAISISGLEWSHCHTLYRFRRHNYVNGRRIRFGTAGFEKIIRIYNRNTTAWEETQVHEKLKTDGLKKRSLHGQILHFGLKSMLDYQNKMLQYAVLSAEKYYREGRKTSLLKRLASPLFNALKSYFFLLGFLDGLNGWIIAFNIARYSFLKYTLLQKMNKAHQRQLKVFHTRMQTLTR